MSSSPIQIVLLSLIFVTVNQGLVKPKRSPLEVGLISFTEIPAKYILHPKINKTVSVTKSTKSTVAIPVHNIRNIWIPGHVHHHSFIPAHVVQHLLNPSDTVVVKKTVHAVVVNHGNHNVDLYNNIFRSHLGGFGVGVDFGGPGAGHGFHVNVNQ